MENWLVILMARFLDEEVEKLESYYGKILYCDSKYMKKSSRAAFGSKRAFRCRLDFYLLNVPHRAKMAHLL